MITLQASKTNRFCDGVSRRDALRIGALAMGGLSLPEILRAEAAAGIGSSNKAVIMVYLPGGPSHQDMWDIKSDAPSDYRGEFRAIPTSVSGVEICEHLPKIAKNFEPCPAIRSIVDSLVSTVPTNVKPVITTGQPNPLVAGRHLAPYWASSAEIPPKVCRVPFR